MITSVRLINFKNFADETLKLGPFTVIVGANASGKSNIRDAFRFLHGIGRGYTLAEIIGGKLGVGAQLEWEPIRGAPNAVARHMPNQPHVLPTFSIRAEMSLDEATIGYSIFVGVGVGTPPKSMILNEDLHEDGCTVYEMGGNVIGPSIATGYGVYEFGFNMEQPNLSYFVDEHGSKMPSSVTSTLAQLGNLRFFEFSMERMKEASVPGVPLGDFGQNLPSALQTICSDASRKEILTEWIRALTPMDVRDFRFPQDPDGNIYLEIVEADKRKFRARSASDGTLRFLAMLAALLHGESSKIYFFEEIDTGIHPARLSLLVDLIERQTKQRGFQVITTTHSPNLLEVLGDESFNYTSIIYRDEESADSIIRPIAELSIASELRKTQGLARLHASGWMENVLSFEHDPEEKATPVT